MFKIKKILLSILAILIMSGTLLQARPTGDPPNGMACFGFGAIDKADPWASGAQFWKDGQGSTNWDYSYCYLVPGWTTWSTDAAFGGTGAWAIREMKYWEAMNQIQVFTFYYTYGDRNLFKASSTMNGYWNDLSILMQKVSLSSRNDLPVIIHFEPDGIGFWRSNDGANCYNTNGLVLVGGATKPSNLPASFAWSYPNTIRGWSQAIYDMREYWETQSSKKILLAHHYTHWATGRDVFVSPDSAASVEGHVTDMTTFITNIEGGKNYDLFFADPADRDASWWRKAQGNDSRWTDMTFTAGWGNRTWYTVGYVVNDVSEKLNRWGIMWQLPVGNHYYRTCNNAPGHWRDNTSMAFLPSTSSNGSSGTPGDAYSATDNTKGPGFWIDRGIIAALFGSGYYDGNPDNNANGANQLCHVRDMMGDGTTNGANAYTDGFTSQGSATSNVADDDGGYLRNAVTKYGSNPVCVIQYSPTQTVNLSWTKTVTPTVTNTPTDCPMVFNDTESLTSNGTWSGSNATRSLNTNAAYVSEGNGSLRVNITTAADFNQQIARLETGFDGDTNSPATTLTLGKYKRFTVDVFIDSTNRPWDATSTYHKLVANCRSYAASNWYSKIGEEEPGLVDGWNHLEFTVVSDGSDILDDVGDPTGNYYLNPNDVVDQVWLTLNMDGSKTGVIYFDNLVFHTDSECPTPTITPTNSPPFTSTVTSTITMTPDFAWAWIYTGESEERNVTADGGATYGADQYTYAYSGGTTDPTVADNATYAYPGDPLGTTAGMYLTLRTTAGGYAGLGWHFGTTLTTDTRSIDASGYRDLEFYVRGFSGGEGLAISFGASDASGETIAVNIAPYLPGGITTGWQLVSIPLSVFGLGVSGTETFNDDIGRLVLSAPAGSPASFTYRIFIDSMRFTARPASPTPTFSESPTNSPEFTATPTSLCNEYLVYDGESEERDIIADGYATYGADQYTYKYQGDSLDTSNLSDTTGTYVMSGVKSMYANLRTTSGGYAGVGWHFATTLSADTRELDTSIMKTVEFYVRGYAGAERVGIKFGSTDDPSMESDVVSIDSYLPGGITTTYQLVSIPLSAFNLGVNGTAAWKDSVGRLVLTSDGVSAAPASFNYRVYFDNMSFKACPDTPTPTFSVSYTISPTPSITVTPSGTRTQTVTPTATLTNSSTPASTLTFTNSPESTSTHTPTVTGTFTNSPVNTFTNTPISTLTFTNTVTLTGTRTVTSTNTPTYTFTDSPTITWTFTDVPVGSTPTNTPTVTEIFTNSHTYTATSTVTPVDTFTETAVDTLTDTPINTETITVTVEGTYTSTPTYTGTSTFTGSSTITMTLEGTLTSTPEFTGTSTFSPVETLTNTSISTSTWTPVDTSTITVSPTFTSTLDPGITPTVSYTVTTTGTFSVTSISTATFTATPTITSTGTFSLTVSPSPTRTGTSTLTATRTSTSGATATLTATASPTYTMTLTVTPTATLTQTALPPQIFSCVDAHTLAAPFGDTDGGIMVLVTGVNFDPHASVVISGSTTVLINITFAVDGASFQAVMPAYMPGLVGITIINPDGQSATLVDAFRYDAKATLTYTVTAVPEGQNVIKTVVPVPNPNPDHLAVDLKSSVDEVFCRIYSKGWNLIRVEKLGPQGPGWCEIPLPVEFLAGAANGTYYYVVDSKRDGGMSKQAAKGKFAVIK